MKCPYCGAENSDGAKFCKECGKSIQKTFNFVCPKCGSPVEEKSKFCDNCGLELAWVDVDYDRIPVPVKSKQNKKAESEQKQARSTPQLVASIVTASLVFVALLVMFIGLFGDVMITKMTGSSVTSNQFTYFFGDAAKNYSSAPDNQLYNFTKALMVVHHIFYFLAFASIIGTIIALAIVIPFNFIRGKKVYVKPLIIPMIASLAYTAYTVAVYCVNYEYISSGYSLDMSIGSGPITVAVGAFVGVFALVSSGFYKWPLSKQKILQRAFFGGSMVFLMAAVAFLFASPISLKFVDDTGVLTESIRLPSAYLVQASLTQIVNGQPAPQYYAASILAFVFSLLAIVTCLTAVYLMKKQRILAIVLGALSIPMIIVPSTVLAHDYAFAVVESGQTIKFGIAPTAIAYSIFVGLFGVLLIVSMIIGKKAPEAE